jgi:hypothetical protein
MMTQAKNEISCPLCKVPKKHVCKSKNGKKIRNGHMIRLYVWIRAAQPDRT